MKLFRVIAAVAVLPFLGVFASGQTSASGPAGAGNVLKPGDRVVFIGDSITGLGERNPKGFVHLIREALAATNKDAKFELVGLGASGWSVMAWESKLGDPKAAKEEWFTDVPNVGVNATLDKKADFSQMRYMAPGFHSRHKRMSRYNMRRSESR